MEKELLESLAETKSYLSLWIEQSSDRTAWQQLVNDIATLQLELALTPMEMQSDIYDILTALKDGQ